MTGPIHPDRFDQLRQAERRLKFLEAYGKREGYIHINCSIWGVSELIDYLILRYPELIEERTEVQANG